MGMSIDESIEIIKHEKPERPTSLYGAMKKNAFNTAIDTMRKYKELEQEPRWIPCSEKKPNKGGEYLLWGKICDDDEEEYCFLGDYYEFEEIEKSNYDPHTLGFLDTEIEEYYSVVAWMPLPKAYREVEE